MRHQSRARAFGGRSAGTAAVMVGHVVAETVDPDRLASASPALIRGVLRNQLGHRGLVFSDDLCMTPSYYAEGGMGAQARRRHQRRGRHHRPPRSERIQPSASENTGDEGQTNGNEGALAHRAIHF